MKQLIATSLLVLIGWSLMSVAQARNPPEPGAILVYHACDQINPKKDFFTCTRTPKQTYLIHLQWQIDDPTSLPTKKRHQALYKMAQLEMMTVQYGYSFRGDWKGSSHYEICYRDNTTHIQLSCDHYTH